MGRFNLSAWAVAHKSLVGFLVALLFAAGGLSYTRLGRAEDPAFTVKLMVVTAQWPGATAAETQSQVAERIESETGYKSVSWQEANEDLISTFLIRNLIMLSMY